MIEGLDLVEEDDQITHLLSLTDEFDGHDELSKYSWSHADHVILPIDWSHANHVILSI